MGLSSSNSIINKDPLIVSPDLPVEAVINLMDGGYALIANPQLVGIFTTQDALRVTTQNHNWRNLKIGSVITHAVITIPQNHAEDLLAISNLMRQHHIHYLPVVNQYNQPTGIITRDSIYNYETLSLVRDITEREQAQIALQESERRYASLAAAVPVGIFRTDAQGNCLYVNERYCQITGLTPQTAMGDAWAQGLHPEDRDRVVNEWLHATTNLIAFRSEYRFQRPDGNTIWVFGQSVAEINSYGEVVGYIGTVTDVSDRKSAEADAERERQRATSMLQKLNQELEDRVNQRTAALQKSEEALRQQIECEQFVGAITHRVRTSLDLTEILHTTVDEVRRFLQADRVLVYQVARDGRGAVVAESVNPSWPGILDANFSEAFPSECLPSYLEGHITCIADCRSEPMLPSISQVMVDFQIRAILTVPIIQEENERLWGLLIAHQCSDRREWKSWELALQRQLADQLAIATKQSELYKQLQVELSERELAESQLHQTNEQLATINVELARATRLKNEFLANMSHELRTPLNAILGMSEGLLEEVFAPLTDQQKKAIKTIEKSGNHLLELINDILDLAKIESGKLDLQITAVPIKSLCESSISFVKQLALRKNITLHTKIHSGVERNFMDERRMRQVLINLLSNAVKFTPDRGTVTLEVSLDASDREVKFSVIDTGIGIASVDKHKLFQTFVQIDSSLSRRHDGTGLGLALVKRIVELHGGDVSLESKVGEGSQFTVSIPWRQELPTIPNTSPNTSSNTSQQSISLRKYEQSPLILVAENNMNKVESIADYLRSQGYQIAQANNEHQAIEMAENLAPKLVVMDIQMLEMDGQTAIHRIRAIPSLKTAPIIVVTTSTKHGERERYLDAGANEYITKPVKLKQLLNLIRHLLNRSTYTSLK